MNIVLLYSLATIISNEFTERQDKLLKRLNVDSIVFKTPRLFKGNIGIELNTQAFDFYYITGLERSPNHVIISSNNAKPISSLSWQFNPLLGTSPLHTAITEMRMVKSQSEIDAIKRSAEITAKAHVNILRNLKKLKSENEIHKLILETFKSESASAAFPCIIGSGKNGAKIHYMRTNSALPLKSTVVVDIGCVYNSYASDISRTYPTEEKFTSHHKASYLTVLNALKKCESILMPGATFEKLHNTAVSYIKSVGYTEQVFKHGVGHHVGLSVHDSGSLRYTEKLRSGMVITLEPGIYDKKLEYGVRIEDMYLITENGFERLSQSSPRELDEIEDIICH